MEENKNCVGEHGKDWKHKMAKSGAILVVILLVLFAGITVLGIYGPDIQAYRYRLDAERYAKQLETARAALETAQKNDTFGGKTPEETFDMFLAALKLGDIELASKYYDVTVQEKALAGLKKELADNGNLNLSIKYFTEVRGGEKKCNEKGDGCTFEYEVAKGFEEISLKNAEQNHLWKITQPY